jgi:5,10-methylene-tetrahydrofolate dehydrogenase/methenyl tetrahydrofolate cyclohydrolase
MLGYIIVGDQEESSLYVKLKEKAADDIGIQHQGIVL